MKHRFFSNLVRQTQATSRGRRKFMFLLAACVLLGAACARADSPQWLQSLTSVPLPAHDEKTDAVLLYSETNVTVVSADKIKIHVREAYKILRPEGRSHGNVYVHFQSPGQKVASIHGWSIPAQGKEFEVKEKDAVDLAPPGIEGGELIDDVKVRFLRIPAPDPGNIVGYEYELEEHPLVLQEVWYFQGTDPHRESRYSLELPAGWEYKASWLNYPALEPKQTGNNHWEWVVSDVKGIRREPAMPPLAGITGKMVLSFFAAGGPSSRNGYSDWRSMGSWYLNLVSDRVDPSAGIKEQVAALTAGKRSSSDKMRALADFIQRDIRYVAIELGIGGWQPHPASEVFAHRYGDCKDKATLMRSMLREIGIESYHVVINTRRGVVMPTTPAYHGFNHAITAIRLPEDATDASLVAVMQHPKLGRLLFFDPTDTITPFGQIRGDLQSNYALLVAPDGGELVELPQEPARFNTLTRTAKLTLDSSGLLKGSVEEVRLGDQAWMERRLLAAATADKDRIKPIESLLAASVTNFHLTAASVINAQRIDQPFGFNYSFESEGYAKSSGGMLLVRPRVLGVRATNLLESKEPRKFPVEFGEPWRATDNFEIAIPAGFEVDDLPNPVDMDYSFASYHSKTEVSGGVIRYSRTFEVKELSVGVEKLEEVRRFYRTIAGDERSNVVLKPASK